MSDQNEQPYAIVLGGIVENVIIWDGVSVFLPPAGAVLIPVCGRPAGIGWAWDGTQFAPVPMQGA